MVQFRNYVKTLSFDDRRLITNQESMKTTPIALTNFMFTGPIDLFDSGIGFRIKNFNQWELESIFDYIKFFNMHKPTKKEFVCSINQILNYEFNDYSNHKFSKYRLIPDIEEMPAKPSMSSISVELVSLNHNKIKETLKHEYLYYVWK
jgi:hypothetical protein